MSMREHNIRNDAILPLCLGYHHIGASIGGVYNKCGLRGRVANKVAVSGNRTTFKGKYIGHNLKIRRVERIIIFVDLDSGVLMILDYMPLIIMIVVGLIFGVSNIFLAENLGPKRSTRAKLSTYESGMEPVKTARERFTVKFYLVAMMFILFDIEIVFMYPWAVQFRELGYYGLSAMVLFMVLLFSGYLYVIKKGALKWD